MAGYHYKLQIIPKAVELVDEENYWVDEQPHPEVLRRYRALLPDDKAWGETEEFRSNENLSVLYIWHEHNRVWSLQFEYAPVTEGADNLLGAILALCIEFGYVPYSEQTKQCVVPSKEALWQDFKNCSQFGIYERRQMVKFH